MEIIFVPTPVLSEKAIQDLATLAQAAREEIDRIREELNRMNGINIYTKDPCDFKYATEASLSHQRSNQRRQGDSDLSV